MTLPPDNALAASDASMTLATQCALAFSTEGSLTPIVARHARELALRIDAALEQARREAVEECAKVADMLAAELEADALTCKANPLRIVYQAHDVLDLQQRQVSEAAKRIRSLT